MSPRERPCLHCGGPHALIGCDELVPIDAEAQFAGVAIGEHDAYVVTIKFYGYLVGNRRLVRHVGVKE